MDNTIGTPNTEIERLVKEINAAVAQSDKLNAQLKELAAQQMENTILKEDLAALEDDAQLYRLAGMVLKKESKAECNETVDKRLEYLHKEISSRQATITDINNKVQTYVDKLNKISAEKKKVEETTVR